MLITTVLWKLRCFKIYLYGSSSWIRSETEREMETPPARWSLQTKINISTIPKYLFKWRSRLKVDRPTLMTDKQILRYYYLNKYVDIWIILLFFYQSTVAEPLQNCCDFQAIFFAIRIIIFTKWLYFMIHPFQTRL